jgi:hypothetical protein
LGLRFGFEVWVLGNNFSPNIHKKVTPILGTLDLKVPEKGIAYDENYVLRLYMKNSLSIKDIRYGSWKGMPSSWYQDIFSGYKVTVVPLSSAPMKPIA